MGRDPNYFFFNYFIVGQLQLPALISKPNQNTDRSIIYSLNLYSLSSTGTSYVARPGKGTEMNLRSEVFGEILTVVKSSL